VVIAGRDTVAIQRCCERLTGELGVSPERAVAVRMDGGDIFVARAGVAELVARFGRIDILVSGAGAAQLRQRLPDIPLRHEELLGGAGETLAASIDSQIGATWSCIRAAAPHMPAGGSVILISTIFSREDSYGRISSVVPAAALSALTMRAADELGACGVRVNQISPGLLGGERAYIDLANAALFLGSDESSALSGETLRLANGVAAPADSSTTFIARPGLRAVDGAGHTVLICAGDQIEEAIALTGVLRSCGAEVVIGFRSRAAIARLNHVFEESRRIPGRDYVPPVLLYLSPADPASIDAALRWMGANVGIPTSAIILPSRSEPLPPGVISAADEDAAGFLSDDLAGLIALSGRLARFWERAAVAPGAELIQPRVLFMSSPDDGQGNVYATILRASAVQLIGSWRHEAQLDHARAAQLEAAPRRLPPVWANQLVRYVNSEDENLEYVCAWAAKLLLSERIVEEITLYPPRSISATTGARQPSFGWAEGLIGLHLGKTALITGGSSGIGGQIGRLLALSGARVMLAARDEGRLAQMRDYIMRELDEVGYNRVESRVQIFPNCDVADEPRLAALVERTIEVFGRVDYLINNAGIAGAEEMVIDLPLAAWERTLRANLISNYSLIRKLAPLMKGDSGYILNVSSYFGGEKHAAIAYPNRADYAVSKAGQRALAEAMARLLGPEVQINALAPGPVEGDHLRGSGDRPGLFMRRARLILENKRLGEVYAALIEASRAGEGPMADLLAPILRNDVRALADDADAPPHLRSMARTIWEHSDPQSFARASFVNVSIAEKLVRRLRAGGQLQNDADPISQFSTLNSQFPEPFFTRAQIEREARKVRDGIMSMLYLQRMPTDFDVAMATVYYLSDRNVSGETFHPSGGLRYDRTPTGAELYGSPPAIRLAGLAGRTVYLIGEHMGAHLEALARAYLERHGVAQVVLICETAAGAEALSGRMADHSGVGRLHTVVAGDAVEAALDETVARFGPPGPVVCTPFRALPIVPLVGRSDSDWSTVLDEAGFAEICAQQLTHHFRVARKVALIDGAALALVTPETSSGSTIEEFALANFVKTTLHAFTATLGVESERTIHRILVNQVDLARQARSEEPRSSAERAQEIQRFIDAVLLTTAPLPAEDDSRYAGRISRGRAITV
jgi:malonyl-CoA reductase/3-hydroxypropionate dehydrogenase (NADP+)